MIVSDSVYDEADIVQNVLNNRKHIVLQDEIMVLSVLVFNGIP